MKKELLNLLNEIANEYECEVINGNEFAYYDAKNLIVVTENGEPTKYLDFTRECGLYEEVNLFTISFFHEIGHHETIDEVEEWATDVDELSEFEYFNIEEEWLATDWAIDFCNNHMDIVEKIQRLL